MKQFNPITWGMVENYIKSQWPNAVTNRQISECFNADDQDVSALTRIMAKADIILMYRAEFFEYRPNFYIYNRKAESRRAADNG